MCTASDVQAELEREMAADEHMPTVKHHKEREYVGMYEYRKDDEPLLIRNLIIGNIQLCVLELFITGNIQLLKLFITANIQLLDLFITGNIQFLSFLSQVMSSY